MLAVVMIVRAAEGADLDRVLAIADRRRRQYAAYQPRFWNPAHDAVQRQREFFGSMLADPETLFVVATETGQVRGFLIARLQAAPPVYDPGGATCLVDDFAVDAPERWPVLGPLLLERCRAWAAGHDATQVVVVTAGLDEPKRAALRAADLTPASEWWVGGVTGIGPRGPGPE